MQKFTIDNVSNEQSSTRVDVNNTAGVCANENSFFEDLQAAKLDKKLKDILIRYYYCQSSVNFEQIIFTLDSEIAMRLELLQKSDFERSELLLSKICLIASVISRVGTPDQKAKVNFLVILKEALTALGALNRKWSLAELVTVTVRWDELLLACLPQCFLVEYYYSATQPQSLCGLFSCLLIRQAVNQTGEFDVLVAELRKTALDLLPLKGKRVYLKGWLDDIFLIKSGFDWRAHRDTQDQQLAIMFSLDEFYSLFSNDVSLLSELDDVVKLERHLKALIVADATKRNEEKDIFQIVARLEDIADTLGERVKPTDTRHWRDRIMSALMFYSGIISTLKNPIWRIENNRQESIQQRVLEKILTLEFKLLSGVSAKRKNNRLCEEFNLYFDELEAYRKKAKANLVELLQEPADNDKKRLMRAQKLELFSSDIVGFIKCFVGKLIEASIEDLGAVPCDYAFIGFGSLQQQSMTLYSDLEFGILIQEDREENREYFRNLTYVLQAKIIQLRETPIPWSLFGYSFDHLITAGFCFDLGGKISLGRCYCENEKLDSGKQYGKLKYELIGTPEMLIGYIEDDYFAIDKLLPVELSHCAHISGNCELTNYYQDLLNQRFSAKDSAGRLFREQRAVTYLLGNDYLCSDINSYSVKLDQEKDEMLFDVKKEIYRLPDRLISDLALFFGIMSGSTFMKINKLIQLKVITTENGDHLKIMDGIAKEIRYSTYFNYARQNERLSVNLEIIRKVDSLFRFDNHDCIERFYRSAYPFQEQMKTSFSEWKKNPSKDFVLPQNKEFNDSSLMTQIRIARRLGQHDKVQSLLASMIRANPRTQNWMIWEQLGESCLHSGDYQNAVLHLTKTLQLGGLHFGADHRLMLRALVTLGTAYGALGDYTKQLELQQSALSISENVYGTDHVEVAIILGNLGNAYGALGHTRKQIDNLERALKMLLPILGEDHVTVAIALGNLGLAYGVIGKSKKQARLQEQALTISERFYGYDHPKVANHLSNLANAYGALGDRKNQLILQEQALAIAERAFGADHLHVANILINLSAAYGAFGDKIKQVRLQERALAIKYRVFGANHIEVANVMLGLGNILGALGDSKKQIELQEPALAIFARAFGQDHPLVAKGLASLGIAYGALGDWRKQVSSQERALVVQEGVYGRDHVEVAVTLVNLGNAYGALANWKKQVELQERALTIKEHAFGSDHPEIATVLTNLGSAYGALGDRRKQVSLQERALAIEEHTFGSAHAEIAVTLSNLGTAYGALGDRRKQVSLQERALAIKELALGPNHSEVGTTLINLGNAYGALGDSKRQVSLQERALAILESAFGRNHLYVAMALENLSNAYGALGESTKRLSMLERALAIQERAYGADHDELVITLLNLSNARGALGEVKIQVTLLERALIIKERVCGTAHVEVANILENLGYCFMRELSDFIKSQQYLERALKIYELSTNNDQGSNAFTLCYLGMLYGALGDPLKKMQYLERALAQQLKKLHSPNSEVVIILVALGKPPTDLALLDKALMLQRSLGPHPLVTLIEQAIQSMSAKIQIPMQDLQTEDDSKATAAAVTLSTSGLFNDRHLPRVRAINETLSNTDEEQISLGEDLEQDRQSETSHIAYK
jgi:tetratricopeptide (TPR) repeat protein